MAVFDVATGVPKPRGVMELPREAEDLDVVQTEADEYQVAFCYKYELHLVNVGKTTGEPTLIYSMPEENMSMFSVELSHAARLNLLRLLLSHIAGA